MWIEVPWLWAVNIRTTNPGGILLLSSYLMCVKRALNPYKATTFRGLVTVEVYVSLVRARAFGRYIADGRCSGVAVKRGSTVYLFTPNRLI